MKWKGCIGLALGYVWGCGNPGYFVCSADAECTEASGGRCEPSGACSFPDAMCPTGRRYGDAGNPNIAGQCVPVDDSAATGGDPGTGSMTGAMTGSVTGSMTGGGTTSGDDSTTGGVTSAATGADDDSSTGQGATVGDTTGSGDGMGATTGDATTSGSTGDALPAPDMFEPCEQPDDCSSGVCAFFVEPGTLDPLGNFCSDIGCVDPEQDCLDIGTAAARACIDVPVNGIVESICALDCTGNGAGACAEDMICLDNILGLPGICAHLD